jgi:hypothetical protein
MRRVVLRAGLLLACAFLPAALPAEAAVPAVAQAETAVTLDAQVMHTQYHENLDPGDDENGFTPGFGIGASALVPLLRGWNPDLYTALNYDFDAGNLHYSGHYLFTGAPVTATDNAVFNRIEVKIGLGYQIPGNGIELIPFLAAGYQAWNRNINNKGAIGTDEFYHSAMAGGGVRLDLPVTQAFVASFDGEILGLVGGGITESNLGVDQDFGPSGAQRVSLGLDDAFDGRFHLTGTLFWQHFTYSGSKPQVFDFIYLLHEPLSSTVQLGASFGIAYSFY